MKFRLCKRCESSISYLLFSQSSLFEYSRPLDNDHNREITLYIALLSHLTTKQVSLLRMPLNRIKRNKKEKSYFHKAHVEEWRREKRRVGLVNLCYCTCSQAIQRAKISVT